LKFEANVIEGRRSRKEGSNTNKEMMKKGTLRRKEGEKFHRWTIKRKRDRERRKEENKM
jgi:hypothetical protein